MQFKSSVSKEEYLKRINGENVSKKQETSEEIKKENVTPSGSPALVNPINSGIEEQEQNGVTVPSSAAMIFAPIP